MSQTANNVRPGMNCYSNLISFRQKQNRSYCWALCIQKGGLENFLIFRFSSFSSLRYSHMEMGKNVHAYMFNIMFNLSTTRIYRQSFVTQITRRWKSFLSVHNFLVILQENLGGQESREKISR
jgi:hypothetical protein